MNNYNLNNNNIYSITYNNANDLNNNILLYIINYNSYYNYYNFNKFKILKKIFITYKTPSLFLDGLYFGIKDVKILSLTKNIASDNFYMILKIHNTNPIISIFKQIEEYNSMFFSKNSDKFRIRVIKTNKNKIFRNNDNITDINKSSLNLKQYYYNNFYDITNNSLFIKVNIPNNILINLLISISIKYNITKYEDLIFRLSNNYDNISFFNEIFNYVFNNINMNIWIKSNYFMTDSNNKINMIWNLTEYAF
jgi:hypothetical protein